MAKELLANTKQITNLILAAKKQAYKETSMEPEPELTKKISWPITCTVGPGLEGAIACETEIGYVNGSKGMLVYRGYDIFDLCAYSNFEEVSYLLLHGELPSKKEFERYKNKLIDYRHLPDTKRLLMSFPVESWSPMSALRLGTNLMRQKQTYRDRVEVKSLTDSISADEDSIPMETKPRGEDHSIYEFRNRQYQPPSTVEDKLLGAEDIESCYSLIAGVPSIAAAIARLRKDHLPLEPDPSLSHAGNFLYMLTGRRPTPVEERIMDVCLILHADHGMNASTFAAMVVASTLSDIYFSVGSGIAALNGPLHGGANEAVMKQLREIGSVGNVDPWYKTAVKNKKKIMGFGHRVYKAYDPRARVLAPLAELLVEEHPEMKNLLRIAKKLEGTVGENIGREKKIFPNVDYYSGIVYGTMHIDVEMFTPIFAVARVAGWTARVLEYLKQNRIFRPRSIYVGTFDKEYVPLEKRE